MQIKILSEYGYDEALFGLGLSFGRTSGLTFKGFNYSEPYVKMENLAAKLAGLGKGHETLIGDTADGYPGCPGTGPVKAEKLLAGLTTYAEMWPVVVSAYEKAGLCEDVALVQAQVARILRAEDFNFNTKEVILWTPNK